MPGLDIRRPGVTPGPRWSAHIPSLGTRPIKHWQYSVSEVRPMTIAAGFRCTDGVLVGADSRIEEGNVKYQQDKVFQCCDDGGLGFVIAGAGDFEAINNCVDLIRSAKIWHGSTGS